MMQNFVNELLSTPQTSEFGRYFVQNYGDNVNAWAYCHRLHAGINTNMHIERMHHTIKYLYLQGKKAHRLGKTINKLMKFIKDKLFERLIIINKGKISTKVKKYQQKSRICEASTKLVLSSTSKEIYIVEEKRSGCNCKLVCSSCEVCIHAYSCTCLDNSIRWNMCKHIHLVCRYKKDIKESPTISNRIEDDEPCVLVVNESNVEKKKKKNNLCKYCLNLIKTYLWINKKIN
nr:PREDICTED: uncharacterized protein LOC107398909 isoform X2 [Tribolium castaneum]|eukprot:XP_015839957.1 PREDICTED: uncharacterized protein LOC107398909 isoform X2 [Tribolium castaneum]